MQNRGVDVVFEQHGARKTDFRRGRSIGTRDHWMTWFKPSRPAWMSPEAYEAFPDRLEVREMRVRGKTLVTTLTPQEASKNELGRLLADRWHVEVDLRHLKTTLLHLMLSRGAKLDLRPALLHQGQIHPRRR